MATQQKEQKRAKKEVTGAAPKAQLAPPQAPAAEDDDFFPRVKARFKARNREDGMVLLNIPVSGWTGDGKTCSLLTLLHYADALQHGLINQSLQELNRTLDRMTNGVFEYMRRTQEIMFGDPKGAGGDR